MAGTVHLGHGPATSKAAEELQGRAASPTHATADACGGAIGLLTLTIFLGGGCGAALCVALWQTCGPTAAITATAMVPAVGGAAA